MEGSRTSRVGLGSRAKAQASRQRLRHQVNGLVQNEVVMSTPLTELVALRSAWRDQGLSVVLTNGCFDILHPGHLALLEAARRSGDRVIVALNSDRSVTALKGAGRPVIPQAERAEILLALEAVDRVTIYDEPTPLEVVRALLPDVLVKGADWAQDAIVFQTRQPSF